MTEHIVSPYPQPSDEYLERLFGDSDEEGTACCDCAHFHPITDLDARKIVNRLSHWPCVYNSRHHKSIISAASDACKCCGICAREMEIVDGTDAPCEHMEEE